MRLLIVSDSHGNLENLITAVERERPDHIFHLGDMSSDAQRLSCACPEIPIDAVVGNCDGWTRGAGSLLVTLEDVTFFLTHGHLYHVKAGLGPVIQAGKEAGADVICFGHTHRSLCACGEGIWVVNPGTVGGVRQKATYAVAEITQGAFQCQLKEW